FHVTGVQTCALPICESFELKVENDEEAVRKTINEFVESYNQLNETFDKLTAFDATSQIGGPLLGDATIRGVREQLRREFSNAVRSGERRVGKGYRAG